MKISDLFEYNMGIQGKDANAKSNVDEPELDVPGQEIKDPKATPDNNDDVEKTLAQGSRKVGAMSGKKVQGQIFAKGAGKVATGKMPNKTELKQLAPILGDVTNAMSNPKFANRLGALLKQASKQGVDESSLAKKILKKLTGKKPGKSIRKKSRLLQEIDENLFEINFNDKNLAKTALDLPIRCGFEAETAWTNISQRGSGQDIDDMAWEEVESELYISNRDHEYIDEAFNEWIRENQVDNYYEDVMERYMENEREDDESYTRFMEYGDGPTEDAVIEYRKNFKDEDPNEYENREEDGWEFINWCREFIDEEYESDYLDYVREYLDEDGEVFQEAFDEAVSETSIEDWISEAYYSMSSFCDDFGIDYSELGSGSLEEVADNIHEWISNSSEFKNYPETGDYGYTSGSPDEWAVENDSSIDDEGGTGAEIISPVFDTPRQMLTEMKGFFEHIKSGATTNSSTGLHVTMSWNGERGGYEGTNNAEANKLKMATLLGDAYLLSTFGRENNTYTRQQSQQIKKKAADAVSAANKGTAGIKDVEEILGSGISPEKMNSINFKREKDSDSGYNLIEFRIGGGSDYHLDMPKIVKAVVRYATIMEAGHTDKYNKDYVNAMYKIVNSAGKIDPKVLDRAKERFDLDSIKEPLVDLFKNVLSKENYFDGVGQITNAFRALNESKQVKEADTETPDQLRTAQKYYVKAMAFLATDIATGKHRNRLSVKDISTVRKSLNEFELSETEFSDKVLRSLDDINIPTQNDQTKQKAGVVKKGIDVLFKKQIIQQPEFLNIPKAERISKGIWNAIHSDGWNKKDQEKLIDLLIKMNHGDDADITDDKVHNMRYSIVQNLDNKEFNSFYSNMVRSSYNSSNPPARPGEPYYPEAYKELTKFIAGFKNYNEPVSKDHNANVSGGDSYIENFLNTYVMKLRKRFLHLNELKEDNPQMYYDSLPELAKMTQDFLKEVQPMSSWEDIVGISEVEIRNPEPVDSRVIDMSEEEKEQYLDLYTQSDGHQFLAISEYTNDKLNQVLDRIAKKEYSDPFESSVDQIIGERMTDCIRDSLGYYYKKKEVNPQIFKIKEVEDLISIRFGAIKDWAKNFDTLSQKMDFDSQADEIADKQVVDKREKQFKKNIQSKVRVSLNIPSYSNTYIRQDLYDKLTNPDYSKEARKNAQLEYRKYFSTKLNSGQVFVIPAAHWSQANDAYEIQERGGAHPEWRQKAAKEVLKTFRLKYSQAYNQLVGNSDFVKIEGREADILKAQGIEITRDGDSREGMDSEPLVPKEQTTQPGVGTPMSPSAAAAWHVNNPELSKKAKALDDKESQKAGRDLIVAAGVEGMERDSSNGIASKTNWLNLAKHLKIEPGVNNQGVNLLKKAYNQYDSNHEWRPEPDPDACCMPRWVSAVRAAHKYILDNYTAGGGNYFRKGPDGKPGDDVSSVHSDEPDYDKARDNWPGFDAMMQSGMNNFLPRGEVNQLVGFLNNDDNDSVFKANVLGTIKNSTGFDSFQDALAATRRSVTNRNESTINTNMSNIFENFENLTLEQQLEIIRNEKISESLSDIAAARLRKQQAQQQDYKQEMVTIWDSQPWPLPGSWDNKRLADAGFKRFSKGWKISKKKFDAIANPVRKSRVESLQVTEMLIRAKKLSENLPNNNKIDLINDILSKEFPAGDIDIQFKAYTALPIPRMMNDFSKLHSAQGPKADGRDILRHYVKNRMSDQDIKKIKLNENKDDLISKLENLPDDENTNKLINYVEQLIDDMGVGGRLQSLSKEIEGIPDEDVKKAVRQIAKIVASVEMSPSERAQLFVDWKADKLVNVDALLNTQTVTMSDIYKGYGAKGESHITELVDDLNQVVQYGIGPGEFALSVLSQRISGMGASTGEDGGKGDLIIDGQPIELKTTRKNAARFNDREVTISNDYKTLVTQFFTKYKDKIDELEKSGTKVKVGSGMQQAHVAAFLQAVPEAQDEVANIISNIFTNLPPMGGKIAQLLKSQDINGAMQLIAQTNVSNYLAKKRASGTVAGILFIDLKKETFNFIKDVADLQGSGLRLHAKTNYLITTNENPFANTSIVQSKSNVSEAKVNSSCPRTKAPDCQCESLNKITEAEETVKAFCDFEHGDLEGVVYMKQAPGKSTKIYGQINGLEPGEHGIHIHEFGDLSKGCETAGGHYDPDGVEHGDLEKGHVGDLGNIVANESGTAKFKIIAERVDLTGDRSVVGRALVVHADRDDLGKGGDEESLKTGNAGDRLGCGVIRLKNMDESLVEAPRSGEAPDRTTMAGGLYKREQMPQLKLKHLKDPMFIKEFGIQIRQGLVGINKLKPAQIDMIPKYVDNIASEIVQFLNKNPDNKIADYLQGRPFIIDNNGYIVNGHHRFHAIMKVLKGSKINDNGRVPFVLVNKTIRELVDLFGPGGTAADLTSKRKGQQLSLVDEPDATDPQIARYKQELEMRKRRSDSASRGWQTRRGMNDPRQTKFDFAKPNKRPEPEETE